MSCYKKCLREASNFPTFSLALNVGTMFREWLLDWIILLNSFAVNKPKFHNNSLVYIYGSKKTDWFSPMNNLSPTPLLRWRRMMLSGSQRHLNDLPELQQVRHREMQMTLFPRLLLSTIPLLPVHNTDILIFMWMGLGNKIVLN